MFTPTQQKMKHLVEEAQGILNCGVAMTGSALALRKNDKEWQEDYELILTMLSELIEDLRNQELLNEPIEDSE